LPRAPVDACLDRLRLGGLVQLTPWVQGHGQGYQLTPHGIDVLQHPRLLARLRNGDVPASTAITTAHGMQPGPTSFTVRPVRSEHALAGTRGERVRSALLDNARPIITQILLVLNLAYFVVGLGVHVSYFGGEAGSYLTGSGDGAKLSRTYRTLGALRRDDLVDHGEWWRLLAYGFLHGGVLHIAFNMYALYSLGPLVERMWGRWQYLALYLVSCLGSGAFAMLVTPDVYLVGASGAICGLLGSMATWLLLNRTHLPPHIVRDWQRNIVTNIILIGIISLLPGISWAGHLGGGLSGALIGVPLNFAHFETGLKRWLGWAGTVAATALGLVVFQAMLPASPGQDRGSGGETKAPDAAQVKDVKVMLRAEELVIATVKNSGLNDWMGDADAAKLTANYRKGKQELAAALNKAKQIKPGPQPEMANYFKTGIELLELAIPYCERAANALQSQQTWTENERAGLRADFNKIQEALRRHNRAFKDARPIIEGGAK
jgi:membrane associated rhomboid family serine protease